MVLPIYLQFLKVKDIPLIEKVLNNVLHLGVQHHFLAFFSLSFPYFLTYF